MEVSYHDEVLEVDGVSVELRNDIKDIIVVDGIVVVLLAQPSDSDDPRNVLAFDRNGNQVWEIEPVRHKSMSSDLAPYISIQEKDQKVVARSWNSYRYEIDLDSGDVSEIGFTR